MKKLITSTITTPTTGSGGCMCIFDLEDEDGKYQGKKPHTDWSIFEQDHSNPGFQYYIECNTCHYQFARQYWNADNSIEGHKCDHLAQYTCEEPMIEHASAYLQPKDVIKAQDRIFMLEEAQEKINEGIDMIRQAVNGTEHDAHSEAYIIAHLENWANSDAGYDETIPKLIENIRKG